MKNLRITIVGGGIGGLASALALSEGGHRITLVERRTGFGETGAGLQVSPNASRVLIGLGLGASLARIGSEPQAVSMHALRSGRRLATVPLGADMRLRYGAPYLVVARHALHAALLDAVRSRGNVRLLVGRSLVAARDASADQPHHGEVHLESASGGQETIEADLVVGADGLWSGVRRALGDLRAPVFRGHTASRAVVPIDRLQAGGDPATTGLWLGRHRHVVAYAIDRGQALNIVVVEAGAESPAGWSAPQPREALLARFDDAAPALRALLAVPETWTTWSLYDLPAGRLAGTRVALVGDAAHPVLPFLAQGAALAIEDAAELAGWIHASEMVPAALAGYASARRARVRRVQAEARRNGRIYHLGGPAALARDVVLAHTAPERLGARYSWLYGWRPSP